MTVKLLVDWRDSRNGNRYLAGHLIVTDAGTEAGLVAARLAQTGLTGGVTFVDPAVSVSRNLTSADVNTVVQVSSGAATVYTIPTDSVLGASGNDVIALAQVGAGAPSFAAGAGVTIRGTAPTFAQYGPPKGLVHMGANEWWYLG